MNIKKIAAGMLVLVAVAGAMTVRAMTLGEMQAQLADLQAQQTALTKYNLADTSQIVKDSSGNYVPVAQAAAQTSSASQVASSSTYQNPASCPPPVIASSESGDSACNNNWGAFYKNSMTGDCCYYKGCEAGENYKILGSFGFGLSLAECQAIPTRCTKKDNSCCKDGKCYEMQNTCAAGYEPIFRGCANYSDHCGVTINCVPKNKGLVLGDSCGKVCQDRGFYGGGCASHFVSFELEFWWNQTNVIGKTKDCPDLPVFGVVNYCACTAGRNQNGECTELCKSKGLYPLGTCQVNATDSNFHCQLNNTYNYAGETGSCKSTGNYKAGCCCHIGMGDWMGDSPSATIKKTNGQACAAGGDCASGYCSYNYCVPNSSYCGGVKEPMYFADRTTAINQWLNGICRFGVWKTVTDGIGCNSFACYSSSDACVNNKCVASNQTVKKANGQQCAAGGECASGNCSYTYCAPAGGCGGVKEPMYFVNGASASNQWFGGVCRNGAWKVSLNNIGCAGDLSFPCDRGSCVNNECQ